MARDFLFVGKDIFEKVNALQPAAAPQVPEKIPDEWKLRVVGEHNRDNASLAVAALKALQLSEAEIKYGSSHSKRSKGDCSSSAK